MKVVRKIGEWLLYDIKRLISVLVVLAIGVTLLVTFLAENEKPNLPAPSTDTQAATSDLTRQTEAYSITALEFVRVWGARNMPAAERSRLISELATPELAGGLIAYEPLGVAPTRVYESRYIAADGAVLVIELDDRSLVALALVNDGKRVRVSNIEPAENIEHAEDF